MALRNSAKFLKDGAVVEIAGPELMKSAKRIPTGYPAFAFVGYPNRDSTPYSARYNIPEAKTVVRGTLRYDGFPQFIQALVNVGYLSDESIPYLQQDSKPISWRLITARLLGCPDSSDDNALMSELLKKSGLSQMPEDQKNEIILGFKWLGLLSDAKDSVRLRGTHLDTLCATLEEKMAYASGERDMVMLQHKFFIQLKSGQTQTRLSTLLDFGIPNGTTSMSKTVGVPCGLATQLVLDGVISKRGVIAPMSMDICQPLIEALEKEGICMTEQIVE